jgi:hypothetical protein
VELGMELFLEMIGDREGQEVPNEPDAIHFKEDEHFHSRKPMIYHIIARR